MTERKGRERRGNDQGEYVEKEESGMKVKG